MDMNTSKYEFSTWPLDLLLDYALKINHRGIRQKGPEILTVFNQLAAAGTPLAEVCDLFATSLSDLENHLMKEENVLFSFLYELYGATENHTPIEQMHCGTIRNPIRVMYMEHEAETERQLRIRQLTHDYATPPDAGDDYAQLMDQLCDFALDLSEHVHIENDLVFPSFERLGVTWILR